MIVAVQDFPASAAATAPSTPGAALIDAVSGRSKDGPLGVYVHVPYCASRCGYCDFNTYTADELGPGVRRETYVDDLRAEIDLVAAHWHPGRPINTVFFGGGTPTLLPAEHLVAVLDHIKGTFGLQANAEVTTEANPESVDRDYLAHLRRGGFTRLSLGMQSASDRVLSLLGRQHRPGRTLAAVDEARDAGFDRISLDLIYGTPGESAADWHDSLTAAVDSGVGHVSAYALTVEEGTAMAAAVRRGVIPLPDPDVAAERYEVADEVFTAAGLDWYEISNWAAAGHECQHNLGYWNVEGEWWGFGPGAHGHVDGVRFVNVKHPRTYAAAIAAGQMPIAEHEVLSSQQRRIEAIMLAVRLRDGVLSSDAGVSGGSSPVLEALVAEGLMSQEGERFVLTRHGRLLGDTATMRLLESRR